MSMSPRVLAWAPALFLLPGCSGDPAKAKAQGPAQPPPKVVVVKVEARDVPVVREYVARTDANRTVELRARVEGMLRAQKFTEGTRLKADEVLFEIEHDRYVALHEQALALALKTEADLALAKEQVSVRAAEADLEREKAMLDKARQDVARLRPLVAQNAVPKQDLDTAEASESVGVASVAAAEATLQNRKLQETAGIASAEAALKAAKAEVARTQLDVDYCTIQAPFDGLVGKAEVFAGNLVGRGEATLLATISALDPIRVTFAISERQFLEVMASRGNGEERMVKEFELVLADGSLHPHKGKLLFAERAIDVKTGTLEIMLEFPNPDWSLRSAQFGRVRFVAATLPGALVIPRRAVFDLQDARVVYVVDQENKVQLRPVELGVETGDMIVVTKGLQAGDTVVFEGHNKVRPGVVVDPTDRPATTEQGR